MHVEDGGSYKEVSDYNYIGGSPNVLYGSQGQNSPTSFTKDQNSQIVDTESEGRQHRALGMRGDSQDPAQNFHRLADGVYL